MKSDEIKREFIRTAYLEAGSPLTRRQLENLEKLDFRVSPLGLDIIDSIKIEIDYSSLEPIEPSPELYQIRKEDQNDQTLTRKLFSRGIIDEASKKIDTLDPIALNNLACSAAWIEPLDLAKARAWCAKSLEAAEKDPKFDPKTKIIILKNHQLLNPKKPQELILSRSRLLTRLARDYGQEFIEKITTSLVQGIKFIE